MIYRVHELCSSEGSLGFEWYGTKREAERALAELRRTYRDAAEEVAESARELEGDDSITWKAYCTCECEIEVFEVPRAKADLLAFLSVVATHADNG